MQRILRKRCAALNICRMIPARAFCYKHRLLQFFKKFLDEFVDLPVNKKAEPSTPGLPIKKAQK
jgi:hypothetical protein